MKDVYDLAWEDNDAQPDTIAEDYEPSPFSQFIFKFQYRLTKQRVSRGLDPHGSRDDKEFDDDVRRVMDAMGLQGYSTRAAHQNLVPSEFAWGDIDAADAEEMAQVRPEELAAIIEFFQVFGDT